LGVSVQRLLNWIDRGVPAERCPDIEDAVDGQVMCEDLRPDVNWSVLRRRDAQTASPSADEQPGQAGAHDMATPPAMGWPLTEADLDRRIVQKAADVPPVGWPLSESELDHHNAQNHLATAAAEAPVAGRPPS
jgi:DNA-binding transcriptional regulator YdaS (Cro superfamily)